ncbi:MAG TPA: ATP-binding protein [Chloroflexota bacterium]|nr:ATP-binding protein [Chloroflexota bacterium]
MRRQGVTSESGLARAAGRAGQSPGAALFAHIRLRLTLWYCAVLLGALLIFGAGLYVGLYSATLGSIDDTLRRQVTSLHGGATPPRGQFCVRPAVPQVFAPRPGLHVAVPAVSYWACYTDTGIAHTSRLARDTAFASTGVFEAVRRSGATYGIANLGEGVGRVRWYAQPVRNSSGTLVGAIQVGIPIEAYLDVQQSLIVLLAITGAIALACAVAGGLFLGERALQPARLAMARQQAFIADASHELRTPLTLLRANAEVLLRGRRHLSDDDVELLDDIVHETAHMAALADNMLTLARLDAGSPPPEREPIDLGALVQDLAKRAMAYGSQHAIDIEVVAEPAMVLANRTLLEQAILALLDNAVKYNRPGGHITLRTHRSGSTALVEIADTGIGIAPEHLPHLGERFYRVDKARSREAGGAGLGLSIARGIATLHGGTLTLASEAGSGTIATLALPGIQEGMPAEASRAGHPLVAPDEAAT